MSLRTRELTVRRLITEIVAATLLMLFVVGTMGVIGLATANNATERLVDQVTPAKEANANYLQAMTDAETGIRGWNLTGREASLEPYRRTVAQLPDRAEALRKYDDVAPGLADLVAQQEDAAQRWFDDYAIPRRERAPGLPGYDEVLFLKGKQDFDQLRATNREIEMLLRTETEEANDSSHVAFRNTVLAMVVTTLVGLGIVMLLARRLTRCLRDPLEHVAGVVGSLASGDASARVEPDGPREVRAVADAVNRLAAENERGREVEAETRDRLLELDQIKTDFVSNVSHELRTPLTSIRGYLELLEDGPPPPTEDQSGMWRVVNRNVERLSLLIEDLLTLSAAESTSTNLTEIDLREVVDDVVTDLRVSASNRGVELSLSLPDEPVPVLADRTQLLRAVLNLGSNAVKFSREDGWVRIALVERDGEALLTITDNGIGIPAEELAQLGSRFFRASNAVQREITGTGLGIRIVQSILTSHAGALSFASVEGEGTTATVTLPLRSLEGATEPGDTAGAGE